MDLSIIIVNWNSKDYLRKCIATILSETIGVEYEIVVIDGASFDGCGQMLRRHYPHVRFVQSDKNIGFAKANNEAFKSCRGKNIMFLNPDTEIKGETVQVMFRRLMTLPDAGIVGARILNTDGTVQTSCIRSFPTILNEALDLEALRNRYPSSRLWGMAALFDGSANPVEVDVISGACMMVRRSLFEKIGMFNTQYFMYSEDIDLCFKMIRSGFKNYYVPSAIVVHHGGGSTGQNEMNTFSSVMIAESLWRFFVSNRSLAYGWIYRISILVTSLARVAIAGLLWRRSSDPARKKIWKTAMQKWLARFRWAMGLENWAKNS